MARLAADKLARTNLVKESKDSPKTKKKAPKNHYMAVKSIVQNVTGNSKIQ